MDGRDNLFRGSDECRCMKSNQCVLTNANSKHIWWEKSWHWLVPFFTFFWMLQISFWWDGSFCALSILCFGLFSLMISMLIHGLNGVILVPFFFFPFFLLCLLLWFWNVTQFKTRIVILHFLLKIILPHATN